MISPCHADNGEGGVHVESWFTRSHDSVHTHKLAPVAALDRGGRVRPSLVMGERRRLAIGGFGFASAPLTTPSTKGQMMSSFFLVVTPVSELNVGDWIMDDHGGRSITSIRRDGDRSYIRFAHGPSNWFHHNETFPTERMA